MNPYIAFVIGLFAGMIFTLILIAMLCKAADPERESDDERWERLQAKMDKEAKP